MGIFHEIGEAIRYFSASKKHPEITFYSESGIYYQNFRATIDELLAKSGYTLLYITSDQKDPIWEIAKKNNRLRPFFIKGLLPIIFPFISTKTVILTMSDLHNFHIKRSTNQVNHIYIFHAINSTHMVYNPRAFDHYDTIFCVGKHHTEEIRKTEEIYKLPAKTLIDVGYSWLEDLESAYKNATSIKAKSRPKILIAPSWNAQNLLESSIDPILTKLLPHDFDLVLRPHPEFIKRKATLLSAIIEKYRGHHNLEIETDSAQSSSVKEADLLITDWSGIGFEFSFSMLKPVIYIQTPMKVHNPDYEKIGIVPLEIKIRPLAGEVVELSRVDEIDQIVIRSLQDKERNKEQLIKLRSDHIFNWGKSGAVGADYIINYCQKK